MRDAFIIVLAVAVIIIGVIFLFWYLFLRKKQKPRFGRRPFSFVRKPLSAEERGKYGEESVASLLKGTIPGEQYLVNDLIFEEGGQTCQIDHVLIRKNGIWVIETKNYAGTIYGTEQQQQWTQVFNFGKQKNKFYNPVKQNKTHLFRLRKVLREKKKVFFGCVVFMPRADLSFNSTPNVYYTFELPDALESQTGVSLTVPEMENYYKKLLQIKSENTVSLQEHVENIHEMQSKIENGICPRCGGALVRRQGNSGAFYGCSNYPKCRFTKKY